jgi:hypothetical protein
MKKAIKPVNALPKKPIPLMNREEKAKQWEVVKFLRKKRKMDLREITDPPMHRMVDEAFGLIIHGLEKELRKL